MLLRKLETPLSLELSAIPIFKIVGGQNTDPVVNPVSTLYVIIVSLASTRKSSFPEFFLQG